MKELFELLFKRAEEFGLPEQDISNAKEMYKYSEFALALDIITTQLYEYDLMVDNDFYELIVSIAKKRSIPISEFHYMKELVKLPDYLQ